MDPDFGFAGAVRDMKQALAAHVLGELMGWDDGHFRDEFAWLLMMSHLKYDGYSDYLAGVRFVESLVIWLRQFKKPGERAAAYQFVRERLVYVGQPELRRLVECFVPRTLRPILVERAALKLGIETYQIWSRPEYVRAYDTHLRRTLFMGLSDGARMDLLRRGNAGVITNEQVAIVSLLDVDKWADLGRKLRSDIAGSVEPDQQVFDTICLIDDFTASGTSLLRRDGDRWKGKLQKFCEAIRRNRKQMGSDFPVHDNPRVLVHHYLATPTALSVVAGRVQEARLALLKDATFSVGLRLGDSVRLSRPNDAEMLDLCAAYYDESLEDEHYRKSGGKTMAYGYGECSLPVVLEHNAPNNSVALLWADTDGAGGHSMKPLFRRRSRHT